MSSGTTHLDHSARAEQLALDVRAGLTSEHKTLPPKYFYDAAGSELFDEITRLPEYYPTRTERAILTERAAEIASITGAQTLNEIGSGTSEKTRLLLGALAAAGTLRRFVAFDVDPAVLSAAGQAISAEFACVQVDTVVGDFEQHLGLLPRHPRRLVAFLGSTIGNLQPHERIKFLLAVRETMGSQDFFLLGTDLVKPVPRLLRAYDDSAGVTAAFNKNVLSVINRELEADFDLDAFAHLAVWDPANEWIEMRLRSRRSQVVHLDGLDLEVSFAEGEQMRTEISAKFRRAGVADELARAGLRLTHWWTDPAGDFALSLSVVA
ncbi:MAG: L-histidine N(alpha)-methyltransferase [Actinomycetota bacterium]|nr:L-histidine N(alpha)-methyltransferase [Actinomycetota bacterium]